MRVLFPLVTFALGGAGRVGAWSAATHVAIGERVLARLRVTEVFARRVATLPEGARAAFLAGCVAPDRREYGWIPAFAHVEHGEGRRPEALEVIGELEAWLGTRSPGRRDWWFHAGRLVHLVSDLAQPMHTATSPEESRVHSAFETAVSRAGSREPEQPSPVATASGPSVLAQEGRRIYPRLVSGWKARGCRPGLLMESRTWVGRAELESRARLLAVLEGRTTDLGREARVLVTALVLLGLAERRLRSQPERGARPPRGWLPGDQGPRG